ncbi:hypothetical protein ScPMuIL_006404 [Solemya velum]
MNKFILTTLICLALAVVCLGAAVRDRRPMRDRTVDTDQDGGDSRFGRRRWRGYHDYDTVDSDDTDSDGNSQVRRYGERGPGGWGPGWHGDTMDGDQVGEEVGVDHIMDGEGQEGDGEGQEGDGEAREVDGMDQKIEGEAKVRVDKMEKRNKDTVAEADLGGGETMIITLKTESTLIPTQ